MKYWTALRRTFEKPKRPSQYQGFIVILLGYISYLQYSHDALWVSFAAAMLGLVEFVHWVLIRQK